jgi:GNAT superfamily N-acetyltransferase
MLIRKFEKRDLAQILNLISRTFSRFNTDEGTEESVRRYCGYYDIRNGSVSESFASSICYVAVDKNRIVGVIRAKGDRIVNLFVDGNHHHKGIGTRLLAKAEDILRKKKIHFVKVRSSLYAAKFYNINGYKKTTGKREFRGLKIQPMRKILF